MIRQPEVKSIMSTKIYFNIWVNIYIFSILRSWKNSSLIKTIQQKLNLANWFILSNRDQILNAYLDINTHTFIHPGFEWKLLSIIRRRRIHFLDKIEGVSHKFNVRLKPLRHDPKTTTRHFMMTFQTLYVRSCLSWCIINLFRGNCLRMRRMSKAWKRI